MAGPIFDPNEWDPRQGEVEGAVPEWEHPMIPSVPGEGGSPAGAPIPIGGSGGGAANSAYGPYAGGYQFGVGNSAYGPYAGGYQFPATTGGSAGGFGGGGNSWATFAGDVGSVAAGGAPSAASPWATATGWLGNNWGNLARGALGAYLGYQGAQGAQNSGYRDISSTQEPWGPSVDYRLAGMERALALLNQPMPRVPGGGGGGGGGAYGGMAAPLVTALGERAGAGHPLYGPSNDYATGALGGMDQNPYRQQVFGDFGDVGNPNVDAMLQYAMGRLSEFGEPSGGGAAGYGAIARYPTGSIPAAGGIGIEDYIRDMLEGGYSENPSLEAAIDAAQRRTSDAWARTEIPGITTAFEGLGRTGGAQFGLALGRAGEGLSQSLGDISTSMGYQDYNDWNNRLMQAMGYGLEYDLTQDQLANEAASRAASQSISAASQARAMANDEANRELQRYLAEMGFTSDLLGMQNSLNQFGLAGRAGLADSFSADQNFALGMVPELSGLDIRDYMAAIDPALQLDAQAAQERARAQSNAWRRYQAEMMSPWDVLGRYTGVIGGLSGGYGTGGERGQTGGGYPSPDPYAQGALGFLGGFWGDDD